MKAQTTASWNVDMAFSSTSVDSLGRWDYQQLGELTSRRAAACHAKSHFEPQSVHKKSLGLIVNSRAVEKLGKAWKDTNKKGPWGLELDSIFGHASSFLKTYDKKLNQSWNLNKDFRRFLDEIPKSKILITTWKIFLNLVITLPPFLEAFSFVKKSFVAWHSEALAIFRIWHLQPKTKTIPSSHQKASKTNRAELARCCELDTSR